MGISGTVRCQNRKAPFFCGGRYRFKHAKVGTGVKQWVALGYKKVYSGSNSVGTGRIEHLPCRTVGGAWEGWLLCRGMIDSGSQERV